MNVNLILYYKINICIHISYFNVIKNVLIYSKFASIHICMIRLNYYKLGMESLLESALPENLCCKN